MQIEKKLSLKKTRDDSNVQIDAIKSCLRTAM